MVICILQSKKEIRNMETLRVFEKQQISQTSQNSKQDITICFISLQSNFSGTDHSILPAMVRSPADRF